MACSPVPASSPPAGLLLTMKDTTFNIIGQILAVDDSLGPAERQAILALCRNPDADGRIRDSADDRILLTAGEVAGELKVHLRTVRRHIACGRLKSVSFGGRRRVRLSDLKRFLAAGHAPPKVAPDTGEGSAVDRCAAG